MLSLSVVVEAATPPSAAARPRYAPTKRAPVAAVSKLEPPKLEQPYFVDAYQPASQTSSALAATRGIRNGENVPLAIAGDGWFVVKRESERLYTRDGRFHLNEQDQLVTRDGDRVLGYATQDGRVVQSQLTPLSVPYDSLSSKGTDNIVLAGNLNPAVELATTPGVLESVVLGTNAIESPDASTVKVASIPSNSDSNDGAGEFQYRITFFDPTTRIESRPSSAVSIDAALGDGQSITLSGLPTPTSTDFSQLRIYRTLADGDEFYRVASLSFGAELSYLDTTTDAQLTSNAALDFDGPRAGSGTLLIDLITRVGDEYVSLFKPGELSFGAQRNGVTLTTQTMPVTSTSTVLELINFMEKSLGIHTSLDFSFSFSGVQIVDGRIVVTSNLGIENELDIGLTGFALKPLGENVSEILPIFFRSVQQANGRGATAELIAYENIGIAHQLAITTYLEFRTSESTAFRWIARTYNNSITPTLSHPDPSRIAGQGLLEFNQLGELVEGAEGLISFQIDNRGVHQAIVDFSPVLSLSELDAQNSPVSTLNVVSQNGFPPGTLTDFVIASDGKIVGLYSTGLERTLGQIVLATFENPSSLQPVGGGLYDQAAASGQPVFTTPGENGSGTITERSPLQRQHRPARRARYHQPVADFVWDEFGLEDSTMTENR